MNKVANTYWINARVAAQSSSRAAALDIADARPFVGFNNTGTRAASRTRVERGDARIISPFAVFSMVIVTMCALCFTVTLRTHAEMQSATAHRETISAEVESLRDTNTRIKEQVERLRTDPRAIETAAREQLGMVRPNDIIIPVR